MSNPIGNIHEGANKHGSCYEMYEHWLNQEEQGKKHERSLNSGFPKPPFLFLRYTYTLSNVLAFICDAPVRPTPRAM
jgi:hypothetical protein